MKKQLLFLFCLFSILFVQAQTTIVVTTSGTGFYNQAWRYTGDGKPLDEPTIKKYWNEDRYITSVAHTWHGWFFAMNKGVKWTNQSYRNSTSWPDSYIQEQKAKGFMITSLASSDYEWVVVTSANTGIIDQQICSAPWSSLKDWIQQWWNKDYRITSIACQGGLWTVVMSLTPDINAQAYMWSDSADGISTKLKEYWDKGYIITALEYGGGEFFCIMSTTDNSASQGQQKMINASKDPETFIQEAWDKGWAITYIGG